MIDITLCSLPYSNLDHINSAPAILKGVVQAHGYTSKTVDFGCELAKLCNKDKQEFYRIQQYFISENVADEHSQDIIDRFYNNVIEWFRSNPSKYIGLCVFSRYTHKAVMEILVRIKAENIPGKIVVGGRGLPIAPDKLIKRTLSGTERVLTFAELLKKRGLVDYVVIGDGEDAILSILDNEYVESNQKSDQFKSPIPNYDDYDFDNYFFDGLEINWPITGSKGCVRDCDFCDVKKQFGKYRYRTGSDIAKEMIALSQKYNARKFQFTDSLVNGGLKPFREFLEIISEHNLGNPNNRIKWNGQYICRPSEQVDEKIYQMISQSGGEGLTIGAESGSNHVLLAMNKKTTVESLFSELEQFKKNNITCVLLMMIGHWSENWDDFLDHCKMIVNLLPYVRSGTVSGITAHNVMNIIDQTPSYDNREQTGVDLSEHDPSMIWICKNNLSNTFKERVYRKLIVDRLARYLKIPLLQELETRTDVLTSLENQVDKINDFYQRYEAIPNFCQAEYTYQNLDRFFENLIADTAKPELYLDLESNEFNGLPMLKITFNDTVLYDNSVSKGQSHLRLDLKMSKHNCLTMEMYGKNENTDTQVIDGKVTADKNLLLKGMILDDVDILADYDFFRDNIEYSIGNVPQQHAMLGFWNNHTKMKIVFDGSFRTYYHTNTKKNSDLPAPLALRGAFDMDYVDNLESKIINNLQSLKK